MKNMTSFDLYLLAPPQIVEADRLEDVACGMYPTYYAEDNGRLLASTSVVNLIARLGGFCQNQKVDLLAGLWHVGPETIDTRVRRLEPFEVRTPAASECHFEHDGALTDLDAFIAQSVGHYTAFLQAVERRWPERQNVVLTGGKDSQLVHLVPKVNPGNWHVLSMWPNAPLVRAWLADNEVPHGEFFEANPLYSEEGLRRVALASDCMIDMRHFRPGESLLEAAKHFHGQCVFWTGTIGEAIHGRNRTYPPKKVARFWKQFRVEAAPWQGISHQTCLNLTGCPMFSIYCSPEIWDRVYRHLDPRISPRDLRDRLGERLAGRPIKWLAANPGPRPLRITQEKRAALYQWYLQHVRDASSGAARQQ